ncbi:hypothetical protein [Algivirga pacifica]|uniref:Uncharacterized protein n=1 Tax=Algivirga pacifica TaxID=1162670 RepID=A0ABP9D5X3_9BACT
MEEKKEEILIAGSTESQRKAWKAKRGKLSVLSVETEEGDEKEYVACRPDRHTRSQVEKYIDKDPMKARKIILSNCLLTGKEEVTTDDQLFYSVTDTLFELMSVPKATLSPL